MCRTRSTINDGIARDTIVRISHNSRHGFHGDLVAPVRELLDHVVVAVLVRYEERALDKASVGVLLAVREHLLVLVVVVLVDRPVKRQQDHLRRLRPKTNGKMRYFLQVFLPRKPTPTFTT